MQNNNNGYRRNIITCRPNKKIELFGSAATSNRFQSIIQLIEIASSQRVKSRIITAESRSETYSLKIINHTDYFQASD